MVTHYIYKITCLCGSFKDHYYIGKRSSRKRDIMNDSYYGSGEKLRRYYKKYAPELGVTITKEIIEINPTKEINAEREREIIGNLYLTDPLCLNLMEGGNGRKVADETSRKKSFINKGRKLSDETKAKMSAAKIRDNSIQSILDYLKTHDVWNKGEKGNYGAPVACYNLDGEYICTYPTALKASEELGIEYTLIRNNINHPDSHRRAGNYIFTATYEEQPMFIQSYSDRKEERYSKLHKSVEQYTLDGDYIKTWDSIKEIPSAFGYKSAAQLYQALCGYYYCRGKKITCDNKAYGYRWKRAS